MSRKKLVADLGEAVRANQAAVDAFDEAVAVHLGINRTDLRCLDLLMQQPAMSASPGVLGAGLGLSTGSVTALIDRLTRLGYVTREPDPADRRKVVVRPTDAVLGAVAEVYGPIVTDGNELLEVYDVGQLETLIDYHHRSRALQERHLTRLRAAPGRG
jgi:DNA-binding MarR family transcriptional regulator